MNKSCDCIVANTTPITITSQSNYYEYYDYHFLSRIFMLAGLIVVSIVGNTLAIHTLMRKRMRKKRSTYLFLNLAMADCLVTIFPMAGQMIWEVLCRRWYAGEYACKIFKFLQTFSLTSSNYMIVAIALDRHRAITRPLSVPFSLQRLLTAAWMFSLLPSFPCLLVFNLELKHFQHSPLPQPECVSNFTAWYPIVRKFYFGGVAVLIFALPLIFIISLYSQIVYQLHLTGRRLSTSSQNSQIVSEQLHPKQNLISRAKLQTTNLSIAIVVTFILTNLPYIVDEFIRQKIVTNMQCGQGLCQVAKAILGASQVSNSAINPFIFLLFNSKMSFARNCTRSCCPLTRTIQNRPSIFNILFRNVSPPSSVSSCPDLNPDQQEPQLEPVKCLLDLSSQLNLASPMLSGCDCRGPVSHNHGCQYCDICHCGEGAEGTTD